MTVIDARSEQEGVMKAIVMAAALATVAISGPGAAAPVDLSGWTAQGGGTWVLQPGNNSVLQTQNGNPTVFFGPGNAQGNQLSGRSG